MKSLTLFALVLSFITAHAQPLDTLWSQSYQFGDGEITIKDVAVTQNGFVFAADITQPGTPFNDILVMRTDADGDTLWSRTFGDLDDDHATGIVQLGLGYTAVCGQVRTAEDPAAAFVVILGTVGQMLRTYDFQMTNVNEATDIGLTNDGGAVVCGYSNAVFDSLYLMRINAGGDSLWFRRHFGGYWIYEPWICVNDSYVFLYDRDSFWPRVYVYDTEGDHLWNRDYQDLLQTFRIAVDASLDGGILLAGTMDVFGHQDDLAVLHLDQTGQVQFIDTFGTAAQEQFCLPFVATEYGGYIAGVCGSFHRTIRFDASGDTLWSLTNEASLMIEASDSTWLVADGNRLTMLGTIASTSTVTVAPPKDFSLSAFPNPFNPSTTISLSLTQTAHTTVSIYDLLGRAVETLHDGVLTAGLHTFTFSGANLPSGLYLARVQSGEFNSTHKLLLLK